MMAMSKQNFGYNVSQSVYLTVSVISPQHLPTILLTIFTISLLDLLANIIFIRFQIWQSERVPH